MVSNKYSVCRYIYSVKIYEKKIFKFHFFLLIFVIIHSVINKLIGYGLSQSIVFGLKIILFGSGFIYFFLNLKPFEKRNIYFSYYVITPIVTLLGYAFGGVFLVGIVGSILLFPIFPKEKASEKKDIIVYHKFQGFLGACCSYEIYKKKYGIFEKYLKDVMVEGEIDFEKDTYWFLEDKSHNEL